MDNVKGMLRLTRRFDAWERLRPNNPGYTYDGKRNGMLGPYNSFQ